VTAEGVVLDASALVAYAQNDLRSMAVDELIGELRDDIGAPLLIPALAHADALEIVAGEAAATRRLWALADEHGLFPASPDVQKVVDLVVAEGKVSRGMAHAMTVSARRGWFLATHAAQTLLAVGFEPDLILDLGSV
jgi:hypothetical protein